MDAPEPPGSYQSTCYNLGNPCENKMGKCERALTRQEVVLPDACLVPLFPILSMSGLHEDVSDEDTLCGQYSKGLPRQNLRHMILLAKQVSCFEL